jgi:hypothetical protein
VVLVPLILDMDDGRQTPFRWLAGGPTGLASATGSESYHGPGRGPANSIMACLVAHRLTGAVRFIEKADELIRRSIHPNDDVDAGSLLDTERRWYYTVFLQALGTYLERKVELRELDGMFDYAQASLLRYAQWMEAYERPYLEHPEGLEFPTETWAAQDMRKAEVFWWAALHAEAGRRGRFIERARFFRRYVIDTLTAMPTRRFTRPIVLLLTNGLLGSWFERHADEVGSPVRADKSADSTLPAVFEPQKAIALRRARRLAIVGALAVMLALLIGLLILGLR